MKAILAGAVMLAAVPLAAEGQQADRARYHVAATVGRTDYDLSVVGQADVYSGRVGVELSRVFGLEGHVGYAAVEEDGGTSKLYTPEAQARVRWPVGRFGPYVGAGAGMIVADSYDPEVANDADVTFSAAGGMTADLGKRVLVLGEVRVRGVGARLTGATGDLNVGVGYRF